MRRLFPASIAVPFIFSIIAGCIATPPAPDILSPALTCRNFTEPDEYPTQLVPAFGGKTFYQATSVAFFSGSDTKAIVAQRRGALTLMDGSSGNYKSSFVADLKKELGVIRIRYNEDSQQSGIMSIAVPNDFPVTPYVYIALNAKDTFASNVVSRVLRFNYNTSTKRLNLYSRLVIFEHIQPYNFHHLGQIAFDADGYLLVGMGDGKLDYMAADPSSFPGSIMRLDVSNSSQSEPYTIPPSNPFVDDAAKLSEIYAWGLRNPFRFSVDHSTGDIWLGDVGGNAWEEVNKIEPGQFHGWPSYEGMACTVGACQNPLLAYPNNGGNAIIGGFVYRGAKIPELEGVYLFGDVAGRSIFGFDTTSSSPQKTLILSPSNLNNSQKVGGFAEDGLGELYYIAGPYTHNPATPIYKLIGKNDGGWSNAGDNVPTRLSDTHCVDMKAPRQSPSYSDAQDYHLNAPLWSDNAGKSRSFNIPRGSSIEPMDNGSLIFPVGSVLTKSFFIEGLPVETRLLVRHKGAWGGYVYEWNEDKSEAILLDTGKIKMLSNGQEWYYPSRSECFQCHRSASDIVLGPELQQLDLDLNSTGGNVINQLDRFTELGYFQFPEDKPTWESFGLTPLSAMGDDNTTTHDQVKSYLHSNCAYCHQPGTGMVTEIDLRYATPFADMGLCDVEAGHSLANSTLNILVKPGFPEESVLAYRHGTLDENKMPPLAKSIVDDDAVVLIHKWITDMTDCTNFQ